MLIPLSWKSVIFACMWIVLKIFCDSYFVEFAYDPTCNYYERGKYGCRNFHVTKLPLVMLRLLFLLSASLHMLVFASYDNLFSYKMPMHRKYVRLICVCHMFHDALFALQFLSFLWAASKSQCLARALNDSACWEATQFYFLFFTFCSCLVINNSSSFWLNVVLCFN